MSTSAWLQYKKDSFFFLISLGFYQLQPKASPWDGFIIKLSAAIVQLSDHQKVVLNFLFLALSNQFY